MSRKETAEKSRIRLWMSTLGTPMFPASSAFQSTRKGRSLRSAGRSFMFMSESSVGLLNKFLRPFCLTDVGKAAWGFRQKTLNHSPVQSFIVYLRSHLSNIIAVRLQQFLDLSESFVPFPQNPQRVKPNLENQVFALCSCTSILWEQQTEAKQMCRTHSFYKLVLEELNIGEEDRRRYPEDLYSRWFDNLKGKASSWNKGDSKRGMMTQTKTIQLCYVWFFWLKILTFR